MKIRFPLLAIVCLLFTGSVDAAQVKDWTVLVFLNGNNNLDSFGTLNLNQMENVGSTDNVNVVVQWASYAADKTKRILVQKDDDTTKVTSPVVEELPRVDMGDPKALAAFIKWGVEHYPARHYFIDVWNHGGGWHRSPSRDISSDDHSGHVITTAQLGGVMREAAAIIGHKVDIYGSDACLMAMAEVAYEMNDSVKLFVGSEDTEPGAGWPYDKWLSRWANRASVSAAEITSSLTEEYVKSFQIAGEARDVTLSAFDLEKMDDLYAALTEFATRATRLNAADGVRVVDAMKSSQKFAWDDYVDIDDFATEIGKLKIPTLDESVLDAIHDGVAKATVKNSVTAKFAKAKGLSIWLPKQIVEYTMYSTKYATLKFPTVTGWGPMLKSVLSH